jgi:glycosyltransferase involved in cell wall biosynthesis
LNEHNILPTKIKVLFILHHSPPIHGAAKVGDTIVNSQLIKNVFNTRYIKIKSSFNIEEIGTLKIKKIGLLIELFFKLVFHLIYFRPQRIYYTVSPNGFAFYRDLVILMPIKVYTFLGESKVYLHYHARGIKEFTSSSKVSKFLTKLLITNTSIIFISDIMKSEVEDLNITNDIFVLNNGVQSNISDIDFEQVLKNRIDNDMTNVLYLSNMIKDKGYDKVLEIAKAQKNLKNKYIHFHFAGSWSSKTDQYFFERFVAENDLENRVTYHGLVSGEVKNNLFKTSNLFVFPSTYRKEIFPLSILEALSYGLPVLTFNTGAIKEIMHSDIGIISEESSIIEDFESFKEQFLNIDSYRLSRKHFLNHYTEGIFVQKLISILKT